MNKRNTQHTSAPVTENEIISYSAMLDATLGAVQSGTITRADLVLLATVLYERPKSFWRMFLQVAARCSAKRDKYLTGMLGEIRQPLRALLPQFYPALPPADLDRLVDRVGKNLDAYGGPLDVDEFMTWALTRSVHPAAQRLQAFYSVYDQGLNAAYAGAWDVLKTCADLGADQSSADECVQNTFLKILDQIDDWKEPGAAKLPTRVYSKARFQARAWRTDRLRERDEFTDLDSLEQSVTNEPKVP